MGNNEVSTNDSMLTIHACCNQGPVSKKLDILEGYTNLRKITTPLVHMLLHLKTKKLYPNV